MFEALVQPSPSHLIRQLIVKKIFLQLCLAILLWQLHDLSTKNFFVFDYSYGFSPFVRDTVWSIIFGLGFAWLNLLCVSQSVIQKVMSLPSIKEVKK